MNAFFLVVNKYIPCSGWVVDACILVTVGGRERWLRGLGTCEWEENKKTKKEMFFLSTTNKQTNKQLFQVVEEEEEEEETRV